MSGRSVAVVGSGAAGLAAALAAAGAGARVTILERDERVGGTTALSGGVAWFPGNDKIDDPPERVRAYLGTLALGDVDEGLVEVFAREARTAAARLERETPLRWHSIPYPDYHVEFEGGRGGGRSLEPAAYDPPERVRKLVRDAPNRSGSSTYAELLSGRVDTAELGRRAERGTLTGGRALVGALLEACLDAGVELRTGVRATTLDLGTDAIVLASGGFERDASLVKAFLRGPMLAPTGVPSAEGDGLRLAIGAGAELGCMSEAWWCPAMRIPGEEIDGAPLFRLVLAERARPGCLIVNKSGRRFVDEAQNYNDVGRALLNFDAAGFSYPHVPAWLVFDGAYRRSHGVGPLHRDDPDPEWLRRSDDLAGLAVAIGAPAMTLEATVARFNEHAAHGSDPDYGRGSYAYDRFLGGLGPLEEPPYYGLELLPGCLGTKGGPRTDGDGRVLSIAGGSPIPGLYAAGNAAASPFGLAYPGAGGTLGPALVFGLRAGAAAAEDA